MEVDSRFSNENPGWNLDRSPDAQDLLAVHDDQEGGSTSESCIEEPT